MDLKLSFCIPAVHDHDKALALYRLGPGRATACSPSGMGVTPGR